MSENVCGEGGVVVTEEMVERGCKAANTLNSDGSRIAMRRALEAALNPPKEPEVYVTVDMLESGRKKLLEHLLYELESDRFVMSSNSLNIVNDVYRAMVRERDKKVQWVSSSSRKIGDKFGHNRPGEGGFRQHLHTRSTDK